MSPIYLVKCKKCGRVEEVSYRSIASAEPLREHGQPCPVAGCGGTMQTIPARSSFQFSGPQRGFTKPSNPKIHH